MEFQRYMKAKNKKDIKNMDCVSIIFYSIYFSYNRL